MDFRKMPSICWYSEGTSSNSDQLSISVIKFINENKKTDKAQW